MADYELNYIVWARAASRALLTDPALHERVRQVIRTQMQILVNNGVRPTWENFTQYGESWKGIQKLLSEDVAEKYHQLWIQLYKEMNLNGEDHN